MDAAKIAVLRLFVEQCKSDPSILHNPSLSFFTTYIQSLGAKVPPDPETAKVDDENLSGEHDTWNDEIVESDIDLDEADLVEPDDDPPQRIVDLSVDVMDENRDAAQTSKLKSMDALYEGKLHQALDHITEAILLNPSSAILYATRANVFVKMNKPNAAICDANASLQINSDSAKGYKARGMARALLGQWAEAASDLHVASKLDFDEEIGLVLKKVEPNARKIDEHHRKYERLRKEREIRKIEHERKRQQARTQATDDKFAFKEGQVIGIHGASELETNLNVASRTSRLTILYFTAAWCGPCRFISPLYTSLAKKHQKVVFLKVDIDEASDVAVSWNVSSVPSFFFIKNGKEVDRLVGADENSLETKILQHAR